MCPYQFARYDVTICDSNDGTQLNTASAYRKYSNGDPIDIPVALQLSIKQQKVLYANLVVSSLNFTSLQAISFFGTLLPLHASSRIQFMRYSGQFYFLKTLSIHRCFPWQPHQSRRYKIVYCLHACHKYSFLVDVTINLYMCMQLWLRMSLHIRGSTVTCTHSLLHLPYLY